jgi:hypothetical protein
MVDADAHPAGLWVTLNEIYSHWAFVSFLGALLCAWTVGAIWPLVGAANSVRVSARRLADRLVAVGDEKDVAREYRSLAAELRADPVLGDSWAAMDRTLLSPERTSGGIYRQTLQASEFFNLEVLGLARADLRSVRAHANAVVGVGLLLTFLGLVLALKAAGGSLGAVDPSRVRDGLAVLLGTAAAKFSFSVIALLLSLLSAAIVRGQTYKTDRSLSTLVTAIDRRLPPLTSQELAADSQATLRDDLEARRNETERMAEILAERFDAALKARLQEAMEPVAAVMTRMTKGVSDSNRKMLEEMAEAFLGRLEGSAGIQIRSATTAMERVGGHVSALADTLAEVRDGLAGAGAEAAQEISQAASDAARGMADATVRAYTAIEEAGSKWEQASANAAKVLRDSLLEGATALRLALDLAGTELEKKVLTAGEAAGERLSEGARKGEGYLTRAAADAAREIRAAGNSVSTASKTAQDALVASLTGASNEASDRLFAAAEGVQSSLTGLSANSDALSAVLREWKSAAGEGATIAARAARLLDAASEKLADTSSPAEMIAELRMAATRLTEVTEHAIARMSEMTRAGQPPSAETATPLLSHPDPAPAAPTVAEAR